MGPKGSTQSRLFREPRARFAIGPMPFIVLFRQAIGSEMAYGLLREQIMNRLLKIIVWCAAVFIGLFVWNMTPDFRPLITWLIVGGFVCHVLSIIVGTTVKRVISVEQLELRSRLELLDRKVTALLKDALEQRRLR